MSLWEDLYTHPSDRQCSSGDWEWDSISGKPSTYPPDSHTHSGGDITSAVANAINSDQVDGCDAGKAIGNVYKVATECQAGRVVVGTTGGIDILPGGTDGYQLTTHGDTGNWMTWEASSDLIFSDNHCPKCGKEFEEGDYLILYVVGHNEVGDILTIPMHKECAEAPKKTITIKRKVMEDRYVLDELTGDTKVQRVRKTQKKTITKKRIKENVELDNKTGEFWRIEDGKRKNKIPADIATEEYQDTTEEVLYENIEYMI